MIKKRNLKSFQESDDALTSIVVTVMLIGIIMGMIIGPILTVQIPNEIKDNEALHMDDVSQSFSDPVWVHWQIQSMGTGFLTSRSRGSRCPPLRGTVVSWSLVSLRA